MEEEVDNRINFLDITISRVDNKILFNINRKPTTTDIIIPNDSYHPPRAQASSRYLTNCLSTYSRNETKERRMTQYNRYYITINDTRILNKITWTNDVQEQKEVETKIKWAKFTHVGRQTKFITKWFKNLSLKVSFKTDKTTGKLSAQNENINQNKFKKCGVYQLTCHDCNRKHTGRSFCVGFQEHFRNFKYGNWKPEFAQHLIHNKHSIAPTEDIMEILHITKKRKYDEHPWNIPRIQHNKTW